MHAPAHPFQSQRTTSRRIEKAAFWAFRLFTYLLLACATYIFGDIIFKGAPNISWKFLTQRPETLYVFEHQGKEMALGDRAFREFKQANSLGDIPATSYVYCSGGIFPCIVG